MSKKKNETAKTQKAEPKKVETRKESAKPKTPNTVRGAFGAAFSTLWATILVWIQGVWGAIKKPLKIAGCVVGGVAVIVLAVYFGTILTGSDTLSAAYAPTTQLPPPCVHANQVRVHAHEATCTEPGEEGCLICTDCSMHVSEGTTIAPLGHDYVIKGQCDATCETAGYTGDSVCTRCGHTIKGDVIPATGHHGQTSGKRAATCTESGHTGTKVCATCNTVIDGGRTIQAKGHTYKNGVCACGAKDPSWVPPTPIMVNFLESKEEFNEAVMNGSVIEEVVVHEVSVRGSKVYACLELTTGLHWLLVDANHADIQIGVPVQAILFYA